MRRTRRTPLSLHPFNVVGLYVPVDLHGHELDTEQQIIHEALVGHGHPYVARSITCEADIEEILYSEAWRVVHITDAEDKFVIRLTDPSVLLRFEMELIFFCSCNTFGVAQLCVDAGLPFAIAASDDETFVPSCLLQIPQIRTSRPVEGGAMVKGLLSDAMCLLFSRHFYSELAGGASVSQAFESARAATEPSFPVDEHGKFVLLQGGQEGFTYTYRLLGSSPVEPSRKRLRGGSASTGTTVSGANDPFSKSVVMIGLATINDTICSFNIQGTGTFINSGGRLLTCWHVVRGLINNPGKVGMIATSDSWRDGVQLKYTFQVIAHDKALDAAILQVTEVIATETLLSERISVKCRITERHPFDATLTPTHPMPLGDSDALDLGQQVSLPGFAGVGGWTITLTGGWISGLSHESHQGGAHPGPWLKLASAVNSGQSGAPLVANGSIVGIMNIAPAPIDVSRGHVHVPIPTTGVAADGVAAVGVAIRGCGASGAAVGVAAGVAAVGEAADTNFSHMGSRLLTLETEVRTVRALADKEPLNHLRPLASIQAHPNFAHLFAD